MSDALHHLMEATRAVIQADAALRDFTGDLDDLAFRIPEPVNLPAVSGLSVYQPGPMVDAVRTAAPELHWRQSYTVAQVGQANLDAYAWFNLVAPDGPFVREDVRISIGTWGQGLDYPRHWHMPEEMYLVLAGGGEFWADDQPARWLGPDETWHNPSNVPHGARMIRGPLLALAVWKGEDLAGSSVLDPEHRS